MATGLGSSAWLRSIVTGSVGIASAVSASEPSCPAAQPDPWDAARLTFAVREPFPSRASATELVFGRIHAGTELKLRSKMPDTGVIFSDGMENDFLRFSAGLEATIGIAPVKGSWSYELTRRSRTVASAAIQPCSAGLRHECVGLGRCDGS